MKRYNRVQTSSSHEKNLNDVAVINPLLLCRETLSYAGPQTTPKQKLSEQSLPFLKEDQYTDTVLVVEGRKIYVNKALLSYSSIYFQKMLENAHKSAASERKSKAEIRVTDKNFPDFVDMIAFIHPGVCRELTGEYKIDTKTDTGWV